MQMGQHSGEVGDIRYIYSMAGIAAVQVLNQYDNNVQQVRLQILRIICPPDSATKFSSEDVSSTTKRKAYAVYDRRQAIDYVFKYLDT